MADIFKDDIIKVYENENVTWLFASPGALQAYWVYSFGNAYGRLKESHPFRLTDKTKVLNVVKNMELTWF